MGESLMAYIFRIYNEEMKKLARSISSKSVHANFFLCEKVKKNCFLKSKKKIKKITIRLCIACLGGKF